MNLNINKSNSIFCNNINIYVYYHLLSFLINTYNLNMKIISLHILKAD